MGTAAFKVSRIISAIAKYFELQSVIVLEVKIMTRKLIFGLLFLIMAASVSACGLAETRQGDTSLQEKDQNSMTIGGETKFSVTGKIK